MTTPEQEAIRKAMRAEYVANVVILCMAAFGFGMAAVGIAYLLWKAFA